MARRASSLTASKQHAPLTSGDVVETMGLEPTTPCLQSRCSSQLSYVPAPTAYDRTERALVPSGSQLVGDNVQLLVPGHDVLDPRGGGGVHQGPHVPVVPPPHDAPVANLVHADERKP